MSLDQSQMLLKTLDQAFDQKSWHGTNLRGSVRGVDHEIAAWRPTAERHSIWEIVLHTAYWKYIVRRRLLGEKKGSFPLKGSDWFAPEKYGEQAWHKAVQLLIDTHHSMRLAVSQLAVDELWQMQADSKVSNIDLIIGIAAHDLHHAGQIQLLKRLAEGEARA